MAQGKQMICFEFPRGKVNTNVEVTRNHTSNFYANVFKVESCSMESCGEHLVGISQLSQRTKAAVDCELMLEELATTVNQMVRGQHDQVFFVTSFDQICTVLCLSVSPRY